MIIIAALSQLQPNNSKENTTMSKTKLTLTKRRIKLNNDRFLQDRNF